MTNHLEDEIRAVIASMENQESQEQQTPQEDIQDIYVLIVREQEEDHTQIVDSAPTVPTQPAPVTMQHVSFVPAYAIGFLSLFLVFSTLTFQLYLIFNPPIATVTIIPKSQQVTLSGTLQLGRVLPPLTISQSQTTPTTGKGHQTAQAATGVITLYNGQFQSVTIATGTILTGASGVQIVTDQEAYVPAGNPATGYGHTTVTAHASTTGSKGNIPAYDINAACCATSVLAANLTSFQGGQDERTYTTVTHKDIHSISTVLKTALTQSMQGALQGQLQEGEALQRIPCTPTVTSNHQPGQEATQVNVTVSQTCSAVAYNRGELATKATAFLATQARQKAGAAPDAAGAGYSLFGDVHVWVTQASVSHTAPHLVFLSFHASGTWIYGLTHTSQEQIKHLIAGKTTEQATTLLASLPGVEHAAIRLSGFADVTRLPKQSSNIHITVFVV